MTDTKVQEALVATDDFIAKELSEFLEYLRELTLQNNPLATKEYVEEVIDITLEEAAYWEWSY